MDVIKTNLPSKKISISTVKDKKHQYENIKTCIQKNGKPTLVINYSDKPCAFYDEPKLVLAHGMHGFPELDLEGKYGISNRDKYVITGYKTSDLLRIKSFLSTDFARYLFKCTRYRMMYLEKYIFRLIPDITKIPNFPQEINNENINTFFMKVKYNVL